MSKMGLLGAIGFSLALVSIIQLPHVNAQGNSLECPILSANFAGPSSIFVKWKTYPMATSYFLDLRVKNDSSVAPVVVTVAASLNSTTIRGLRPGTEYNVSLKVFKFYTVACQTGAIMAYTVPDAAQIKVAVPLSSTSIRVEWNQVPSAQAYYLVVISQESNMKLNLTYTSTSAVVENLQPITNYDCYVYTRNAAGEGSSSRMRTVTTLTEPPENVTATQTSRRTARVTWWPVEDVLLYQVSILNVDNEPPSSLYTGNVAGVFLDVRDILPCTNYLISVSSLNPFLVPSEPRNFTFFTNNLKPVSSVTVEYSCLTNSAIVRWAAVLGADSYQATVTDETGAVQVCTSQGTDCTVARLNCGQSYTAHVIPISQNCRNTVINTTATFQTVPCPPMDPQLLRDCSSEVIVFSWNHTNNTDYYEAWRVDSRGHHLPCVSAENSCYFTQNNCGQQYQFKVFSIRGQCKSEASSMVEVRTAPCIPQNVQMTAECKLDYLIATWDHAEGALEYTVEAYGNRGNYSCTSVSNTCAMTGIRCGDHFTTFITALDNECTSPAVLTTANTVPCTPQDVSAVRECGADGIMVTWGPSMGALFYIVIAKDSDNVTHHCNTFDLTCQINGLSCSTNYTVYVISTNLQCNSTDSETVVIETAACPPDNVTSLLDCEANKALISWHSQTMLNSYTATMVDEDKVLLSCSTSSTSCRVENLKCDKLYTITVGHHDGMCPSIPSAPIYMESVPCGPLNLEGMVDCMTKVLTLSWSASPGADGYYVRISHGNSFEAVFNTTQTHLMVEQLVCGLEYTVQVKSYNRTCVSFPSTIKVKQVPCVPIDVVAKRNCSHSFIEVMWTATHDAVNFTVVAIDEIGSMLKCTTNMTKCMLKGAVCSKVYNITVFASNDICSSTLSSMVQLPTVPCPPSLLSVVVDCVSDSAILLWSLSPNAVSYTGKAVTADGHNVTCVTRNQSNCGLSGLQCGKKYTFTVSASDGKCESLESTPVVRQTAPCAVQDVITTLNCSTNVLSINWQPGPVMMNYTATAVDIGGTALSCTTTGAGCMLPKFVCGQLYTVTVRAVSSTCVGHSSVPEVVHSVPCVPMNVQGMVECSTNVLQASWDAAAGAMRYMSKLTGAGGFSSVCTTSNINCSFSSLQCAQTYELSVVAVNDRCNSSMSAVVSAKTAPCDPTNINVTINCQSYVATVMWTASGGARRYTVLAQAGGYFDSCNSTGTSCELRHLQCGKDYNVTVLAGDEKCNSSIHVTTNVTTAPCPPVIQSHSLDCVTNNATVTWVKDEDAVTVKVKAMSGGHTTYCSSTNTTSCVLDDLMCGRTYTAQAVARGHGCWSEASADFEIITGPCTPANVVYTYSCDSGIVLLTWDETLGRKSFYAQIQSCSHMVSCKTEQTECTLFGLLCSRLYDVTVIAVADHCNSSVPAETQIQSAPCAPLNVTASLVCDNNTAAVSWLPSSGAVSYSVTAQGRDGDVKQCTTTNTSCDLPNLHCAQTYIIHVTPFNGSCQGLSSAPYTFIAGPCPPSNVHVSLKCVGNIGHVSWDAALLADQYVVTAVDDHIHTCSSTNGPSCNLTDMHCGETSVVTVVTIERGCTSKPSTSVTFQTVICPPNSLTAVTTCSTNDITAFWDQSPESGVSYFLRSREDGGSDNNITTMQTSHMITGLQCSKMFHFTVAASDSECTSIFSDPIVTETAPCPPTNLSVVVECGTNLGRFSWSPSVYATSYTVAVTGTHGQVAHCTSTATMCSTKLDCGHQYSAFVIASSSTCNSSASDTIIFDSAPCLPDRVEAEVDCGSNSFAVEWRGSIGDVGSYTAIAIAGDGSQKTCNSLSTNCTIQSLECGVKYSIVVTTSSVDCGTIEGSDYFLQSAPCKPNNVLVDLQCSTNVASVTWGNSGPDQVEVVSAADSRGHITTCLSGSSNCTFDQLICGETYIISVVGHTNTCNSDPALAQTLKTAPCVPTHLSAQVDCETGITTVTWDSASGATSYTVYARGSLGHYAECNNTDIFCSFSSLECGQDYNITVVARHDSCVSLVSKSITATMVPCPHRGLNMTLDCNTNTAIVFWTPGRGIVSYNATANSFGNTHMSSCSTNGSTCNITSLRCGTDYMVRVSGRGQTCSSPAVEWKRIMTAPCAPTNLTVSSSCTSNNISVSWQSSMGSLSYRAVAEDEGGRRWSCNTSSTSCQISNLLCGQTYNVYAVGIDDICYGAKSNIVVIQTAPCVVYNIQTNLDCLSAVLNVTWDSMGHYQHFRASVVSNSSGHVNTCVTNKHYCVVHGLHCNTMYNVTVRAEDMKCNSSLSPTQWIHSAPCPLSSYQTLVDCDSRAVSVTWNNSEVGVVYTVSAVDQSGDWHDCNGTNQGCDLTTLACGTEYNVTITPSRSGCVGRNSSMKMIRTVPCIPTLLEVEIDCLTNSAWLIYADAEGAEGYVAVVTDGDVYGQTYDCNATTVGLCPLPPLECSKNLTFALQAADWQCVSHSSNAIASETAPCPPQDVGSSIDCDNGTISISWASVPGAVTYTATLEQATNTSTCCTTSNTTCDISNLPCGQIYILHVTAEGQVCNSTESRGAITRTVPCVPQNLKGSVDCSNNVATMIWDYSKGGQMYEVTAVGDDGHVDRCMSYENQCDLTSLRCGQYYVATVAAADMDCASKPSDSVTIKTVPCSPAYINTTVECVTDTLTVSWPDCAGANSYIATVQGSNGGTTTCVAMTEGFCNVTGIGCGQLYHVYVVSSDGYCDSPPSPEDETPSVPCDPQQIKAEFDCYTQSALVSWLPSDGGLWYQVSAFDSSGRWSYCTTNFTSCELEDLTCGDSYTVHVQAIGWSCNSSVAQMTGQLDTEPCIPEHITTQYSLSIGQVSWDMTTGAEYYTVLAETDQGLIAMCNTTDVYCALYNLVCSQMYNIHVTANNFVCQDVSVSNDTVWIVTEPCPPRNCMASVRCEDNTGSVSWEASAGAVGYKAQFAGRNGHSLSCYTNQTFCDVGSLHCGNVYYVSVIAIGETLNSSTSDVFVLESAPCPAGNVQAVFDMDNNTASVSWTPVIGVLSYIVDATSADGYRSRCETTEDYCELTDLQCGQTYNICITSSGNQCQIETKTNVSIITCPCKPSGVGVDLQCGTHTANMHWEQSDGVDLYIANATCSIGETVLCNSTNSTCQFPNLYCGDTYMFSVTAYAHDCYSETSSAMWLQTEPCQPTGLMADVSCYNDTVMLDWSVARGALMYIVNLEGNLGYVLSFQTTDTMLEVDLPCGQVYTFTVVAQGDQCDSAVSLPTHFRTGPCVPQHVESFTHCENNLGSVSWAPADGAESYLAVAMGLDGHTHECVTNTTSCTWDDLHCGEQYTVNVIAIDKKCSSLTGNSTSIRMAPCIPQGLKSSLDCATKVGSLTWNATETADFYIVTAEAANGHKVQLSTNDTWTYISEFMCGQEYFLSVQAVDSVCTSVSSQPSVLDAVPCPPTGVSSRMDCVANIALMSWTSSPGALFYTASVTSVDGVTLSCSSDSNQCGMPNVRCGTNYNVTVIASDNQCDSDPSNSSVLQSVPCVPTNVVVKMECAQNIVLVSWSASEGALAYKVQNQQGEMLCETTGLSCYITNLTCGQSYSIQVVALDDTCSSLPSPFVMFNSVPCSPTNTKAILDCHTNTILVDWLFAEGALSYTVLATTSDSHISTCTSNLTNCELENLQCGQNYTVIVVATNENCSSIPSANIQMETVPCPPEDVMMSVQCSSNTGVVWWEESTGADYYYVQAFGVQEHETSCETSSLTCTLPDLMCGYTYNVSVIAINSMCNVSQSDVRQMQAVPCVPEEVEARLVCESGAVAVSWEPSKGASSYSLVAQGSGGYASTCTSNVTSCVFTDLVCGLNYSITVSASDDNCSSAESSPVEINTLPCTPQVLSATMICSEDTGVVVWEEEEDVSSYVVNAFGPNGHKSECNSTGTTCELHNLYCGQLYNLTLTALDGQCDNSRVHFNLQSVPCRPTNVQASLQCLSDSAAVTWEPASGALSYVAVGVTADWSHRAQCNNTMTYCDLSELQCGQTYNVSVFSQDESCSSALSGEAYVRTAPCPPQNVMAVSMCDEDAITVSWTPNPDAQYVYVTAVSSTGRILYCNSTTSYCTLEDLPCGQSYNFTLVSVRDGCESKRSETVESCTAPCVPTAAHVSQDCVSNSAWVRWETSEGAVSYIVNAVGERGELSNCTTDSSHCKTPDLQCGTLYTFTVTAINRCCHSNHSEVVELETGPCSLTNISAATVCNSNIILVEWEHTNDIPIYLVTAEGQDDSLISCNTSSTSCFLEDALCGMEYSIIVSASSDKCNSLRSQPRKIKTTPCPPDNITVVQQCEERATVISWGHSYVATSYQLTATGRDGYITGCNSTTNNCTLNDLPCGQPYSLSITASRDTCTGLASVTRFSTVPCKPSGLAVEISCITKSALLTWDVTEHAVVYYALGWTSHGVTYQCVSTETSCTIEGLECGEIYTFAVQAFNGVCNSSMSDPVTAGVVPCPPTNLNVRMQRIEEMYWARTSWGNTSCPVVEYQAHMGGRINDDPQTQMSVSSYWSPRKFFEFLMPCSTSYNLTVRAKNSAGIGEPSYTITGVTAPCPPQNITYSGNTQSALLVWDASVFATSYTVYQVLGNERLQLCSTSELSCTVNNFNPNTTGVTASNEVGESNLNRHITGQVLNRRRRDLRVTQIYDRFDRALETPELLSVTVSNVSMNVKWMMVKDATEYVLVIEREHREPIVRTVEGDSYLETDLKPWTNYCVRLFAKNTIDRSDFSQPKCRTTGAS